ncbi:hypothetical protein KCG44_10345 [Pacificimonas sp. WHA3]|uniref:Growth inhibitor PemK n=1 Tax=Pacificimonas pallii TaxID=2827236 RepID=A0ABS6SFR0_9SPHN|nr:type II toxin-antitoxin system PemK/MazF family toxin [Pacificimonas pallii]MBV7257181.1 hypothetical protein [Pacificimonas pallii]
MTKSTPSKPRNPARPAARSTTSWPTPEPGETLSYSYLWRYEYEKGIEEGRKDRPVAVIVALTGNDDKARLFVAPITTQTPDDRSSAIEVPARLKGPAGLDAERCWVVPNELNIFTWPGPDIRPVERVGERTPIIGAFPSAFYERIRAAVEQQIEKRAFAEVDRD